MATTVTKVVRKDTSAVAKKAAKQAKQYRNKNKSKINSAAKKAYKHMSLKEKKKHLERVVWRRAKAHGATDAEADKAVLAYKKNRQRRNAGKHAAEKHRQAVGAQKAIRSNLKAKSQKISDQHKKNLAKIKSNKGTPAVRAKLRLAEKQRYANERTALAKERNKAVTQHKSKVAAIKKASKKNGPFRLANFISNFSKPTLGSKGKRLKTTTVGPKTVGGGAAKKPAGAKPAAAKKPSAKKPAETAAISEKHFGGEVKKSRGRPAGSKNKPKTEAAPAAPAAPVKKPRGRPAKPKTEAAPAAKPAAEKKPAAAKKPATKPAAKPAAAKPATTKKGARQPKVAAQPEWKGKRKSAAVKAWEAATGQKATVSAKPAAPASKPSGKKPSAKPAAAKPAAKKPSGNKVAGKTAGKTAKKKPGVAPKPAAAKKPSGNKAANFS